MQAHRLTSSGLLGLFGAACTTLLPW